MSRLTMLKTAFWLLLVGSVIQLTAVALTAGFNITEWLTFGTALAIANLGVAFLIVKPRILEITP